MEINQGRQDNDNDDDDNYEDGGWGGDGDSKDDNCRHQGIRQSKVTRIFSAC